MKPSEMVQLAFKQLGRRYIYEKQITKKESKTTKTNDNTKQ